MYHVIRYLKHNFKKNFILLKLIFRLFSNRFLRKVQDQDVEWGYCFDVHLNAFFPCLVLLHVLLPIIYPGESFLIKILRIWNFLLFLKCLKKCSDNFEFLNFSPDRRSLIRVSIHRQHDLVHRCGLLRLHYILGIYRWDFFLEIFVRFIIFLKLIVIDFAITELYCPFLS